MYDNITLPAAHAARRVACPGSRILEMKCDTSQESEHAREGKEAHKVAADYLSIALGAEITEKVDLYPGTQEMTECAKIYVNNILEVRETLKAASIPILCDGIEQKFNISSIHANCWGSPDYWMATHKTIFIWDYKFGHSPVEVKENWQLISYAAALLQHLKVNGQQDSSYTIVMRIIQPRSFTESTRVKEWTVKASHLRGYFNQLQAAEYKALEPDASCFVSSECGHCPARAICPTLQQAALTAIDISKSNTPWELDGAALSAETRFINQALTRLKARQTGLEEQLIARLMKGERIPHFSLGAKSTKQVWCIATDEAEKLAELYSVDIFKPRELITPKQAITAGIPDKQVAKKSKVITGKVQLIEEKLDAGIKAFGDD